MTCPHCGAETPAGFRFCQRCRKRIAGDPAPAAGSSSPTAAAGGRAYVTRPVADSFERPMAVTLLAVLDLIGGVGTLLMGALMAVALFGASRSRSTEDLAITAVMLVACVLLGGLSLAAGVGLLKLRPWGRTLQLISAGIGLLGIPCGTLISVLIFVYLLKPEVRTLFSGVSPRRLPPEELARVQALTSGGSLAMVVIAIVVLAVVAVPVVGIVAAIAIPSLLRARVSANESATIGDLRTMVSAQVAYASANGGFPDRLECLAAPGRCLPHYPAGSPVFLDERLTTPMRHGYQFQFVPGPAARAGRGALSPSSLEGWAYVAQPVTAGQTGVRAFCADMSGVICFSPGGRIAEAAGSCPSDCTPLQ